MLKTRRRLWLIGGYGAVILGTIGVFLPLLPTVPFLLLAVYCFSHGAPRQTRRLMENKWLGPPLRDYHRYHAVKKAVKITTISFLWVSLSIGIYCVGSLWLQLLLACIGIAVTIHILALKTLKRQ